MQLDKFNLTELGVFIAGVCASISGLFVVLFRSKCETITCCCMSCKRNVEAVIQDERLQMTGHANSPKDLNLELKEPEAEIVNKNN